MVSWPRTYTELAASVRSSFGVTLAIVSDGDECDVMCGRLESGCWLVVSDADGFLGEIERRLESEDDGYPLGWFAGIYTNDESGEIDCPTHHADGGCVAYAQHDDARFHELNGVIREAIEYLVEHFNKRAAAHQVLTDLRRLKLSFS